MKRGESTAYNRLSLGYDMGSGKSRYISKNKVKKQVEIIQRKIFLLS